MVIYNSSIIRNLGLNWFIWTLNLFKETIFFTRLKRYNLKEPNVGSETKVENVLLPGNKISNRSVEIVKLWNLKDGFGTTPRQAIKFGKFESLLYIASTMKNFWVTIWKKFAINRLFKIALKKRKFDFTNAWKQSSYIGRKLLWNFCCCQIIANFSVEISQKVLSNFPIIRLKSQTCSSGLLA